MPAKIHFTKREINKIIRLHKKERLNIEKIGQIMGISHGLVHTILKKNGVNMKETGNCYAISPEKWPKIIDLYIKKKFSIEKIARRYRVSRMPIETILRKNNIPIRSNSEYVMTKLSKAEIVNMIQKYTEGKIDITYIRKTYKISHERITKIFKEFGIEISPKLKLSKNKINKMINKYNSGKSICLIAKEVKLSCPTIKRLLEENGVEIQNGGTRIYSIKESNSSGISGYYKDFYFRSINELSFIINYLERKGIMAIGERHFYIKYLDENGKERKYFPDFATAKYIFEVKPKEFWNDLEVILKKDAGEKYAKERGLKYLLVDYPIIIETIIEKFYSKEIKFTKLGKKKFFRNYKKYLTT